MATTTIKKSATPLEVIKSLLRGVAQVMFQENSWTGLLFLIGIFWGAYAEGSHEVAWGALVGVTVSTLTGWLLREPTADGDAGLWGFNGVLVGCAFPTFLGTGWIMWICLILCAALTTIVRRGFNNVMAPWKVNSFTFPFVFTTWIFLLSARVFAAFPQASESIPDLPGAISPALNADFGNLVIYWLKGIGQIFLINSWITGIFFLAGLGVSNIWSCIWAAVSSAIALAVACLMHATGTDIAAGLYGFSAVLTGIALGCTFYKPNSWRVAIWTILGVITTVFVQAAMNAMFAPLGLATLTGPFCVTTWLFLLPLYKFNNWDADHSNWKKK